ncbi:MAG: ferredoxin [Bdellovibrionaceae bacterium]|nr:ferredoxin [Pseudobdellovibrionaceae bacterium]
MPFYIDNRCTSCGACLSECPTQSIRKGMNQYVIDTDTCDEHELCVQICPEDAIHLLKSEISPPQDKAKS